MTVKRQQRRREPLRSPWGETDLVQLRALAAQGLRPLQIALRLRRSTAAVRTKASMLGIAFAPRARSQARPRDPN